MRQIGRALRRQLSTLPVLLHSASLTPCATAIAVHLQGAAAPEHFPLPWLWANAPGHHDPDTSQRSLGALALSTPPALQSIEVAPGGSALLLHWHSGSSSSSSARRLAYPAAFLHRHRLSGAALQRDAAAAAPQPLPTTRQAVPAFDYAALQGSPSPPAVLALLQALNACGIALVRGCPTGDPQAVTALARCLAPVMPTIYGESFEVSVQEQPINVAYTSGALALHQDLAYYESPPGLQLLLCREFSASVRGGESTFACALSAAEALRAEDPAAFATLCRVPTTFQKVHYARASPAHIVTARPIVALGPAPSSAVTAVFWAPPFEGPLRVPLQDVAPYYAAYRAFASLLEEVERGVRPGLLQLRLAPGEALVFNQRRLLHGRRAFDGQGSVRRVLQGCYINADEWMSRLRSLAGGSAELGAAAALARTGNQQQW